MDGRQLTLSALPSRFRISETLMRSDSGCTRPFLPSRWLTQLVDKNSQKMACSSLFHLQVLCASECVNRKPVNVMRQACRNTSNVPIAYPPVSRSKQRKFSTIGIFKTYPTRVYSQKTTEDSNNTPASAAYHKCEFQIRKIRNRTCAQVL